MSGHSPVPTHRRPGGGTLRGLCAPWLAVAVALAGCAGGGAGSSPRPTAGESKDRVTASDESDASRRARVRMELATAYYGQGQMTAALDQVKLAIVADPSLGDAFNLRGLIYANLGDDRLAEDSFRRALQLNSADADTMQNFGYYLCQKKRYPEADALFEQALAVPRYRNSARTLLTQGVCQAVAGRLEDAERTLMHSYQLDAANPSTAVNLSEVLYRRGDYERARFYIGRVNAVPAVAGPQTLWLAARIEHRAGRAQAAQDFGGQLVRRFPDSPEAAAFTRGAFDE